MGKKRQVFCQFLCDKQNGDFASSLFHAYKMRDCAEKRKECVRNAGQISSRLSWMTRGWIKISKAVSSTSQRPRRLSFSLRTTNQYLFFYASCSYIWESRCRNSRYECAWHELWARACAASKSRAVQKFIFWHGPGAVSKTRGQTLLLKRYICSIKCVL